MRSFALPLLAFLATPLVALALPLAADHPLRGTIALLPAVVIAAASVESWMRRRGLASLATEEVQILGALVALLTVLGLWSRSLGLAIAEVSVAGALFLVLFFWLARVLPRLRPLLGKRLKPHPPAVFFWLPLIAYLSILPWGTQQRQPDGDEPYFLLIAHSIVHDLDIDLANNYRQHDYLEFLDRELQPQPGDKKDGEASLRSRHPPTLSLLLAVPYLLAGKLGVFITFAVMAAALAQLTLRVCSRYYPTMPGEALLIYALVALSPPLLIYSHQVWAEIPAALLLLLGVDSVYALSPDRPLGEQKTKLVGAILPIFLLPVLKLRLGLIAAGLVLLLLWRRGGRFKVLQWLGIAFVAFSGAILGYNQIVYGHALRAQPWSVMTTFEPPQTALGGLFFDAAFGLFAFAPIWLILLPAAVLALRRREPIVLDLALVCGGYLALLTTAERGWYGGWAPPFRLGLLAVPMLAIMAVPLLRHRRRAGARVYVSVLLGATVILSLVWTLAPGLAYDWTDGTMRLTESLGERFGADVGRLVPSYLRPRAANWIWPLVALAVSLLWWRPRRRLATSPEVLGAAALLLMMAAAGQAATHVATTIVEFEDRFIDKSGGSLIPGRWVDTTRPRGWALGDGDRFTIPVVAGGRFVDLAIDFQSLDPREGPPARLQLRAGGRPLDEVEIEPRAPWRTLRLGPYAWQPHDDLELELRSGPDGPCTPVFFDRMSLEWH